jgi:hypothetical protein
VYTVVTGIVFCYRNLHVLLYLRLSRLPLNCNMLAWNLKTAHNKRNAANRAIANSSTILSYLMLNSNTQLPLLPPLIHSHLQQQQQCATLTLTLLVCTSAMTAHTALAQCDHQQQPAFIAQLLVVLAIANLKRLHATSSTSSSSRWSPCAQRKLIQEAGAVVYAGAAKDNCCVRQCSIELCNLGGLLIGDSTNDEHYHF